MIARLFKQAQNGLVLDGDEDALPRNGRPAQGPQPAGRFAFQGCISSIAMAHQSSKTQPNSAKLISANTSRLASRKICSIFTFLSRVPSREHRTGG
jgi:hypothetical protein